MAGPADDRSSAARREVTGARLDVAGVVLLAAAAGWATLAAAGRSGARPWPVVSLVVATGVAVACGRALGRRAPRGLPAVLAVATAGAFVLGFPDVLRPGGGPTGYANANADLALVAAIAAAAVVPVTRTLAERRASTGLTVVLVACAVGTGSVAALLLLVPVVVLVALAAARREQTPITVGGLVLACAVLGSTVAISHGSEVGDLRERAGVRAELWSEAADAVAASPLRGVGPGTFGARSQVSSDADLRWPHHDYLQAAAELGVVGLGLLLALVGWAYARIWVSTAPLAPVLAGAAALTIVATHAAVDHVLNQPAVPLTVAVLVGWATAGPPVPGTRGSRRPRR
jgi:O-antigen ligase